MNLLGDTVELELPASYAYLGILSAVLGEVLRQTVLSDSEQAVYNVQLAAHEACANIVRHAYAETGAGRIRICIAVAGAPERVVVQLFDRGRWFDINKVETPDLDQPRVHGYGIFLIRQLVDEVRYERQENVNMWELVKYL